MSRARRSRFRRFCRIALIVSAGAFALWSFACGTDIDLGGSADASLPFDVNSADVRSPDGADIDSGNEDCEPCLTAEDCHSNAACVQMTKDGGALDGGETYCATSCPSGSGCRSDQTCHVEVSWDGRQVRTCVPKSGACPSAAPPSGSDGAPLERCGSLTGPEVPSACRDCRYDCQPNGCYGGWWCNTVTRDCVRPPKTCL